MARPLRFEAMTDRRYEYIEGLNGYFEIALYGFIYSEKTKRMNDKVRSISFSLWSFSILSLPVR